jgi:hypothetical protein
VSNFGVLSFSEIIGVAHDDNLAPDTLTTLTVNYQWRKIISTAIENYFAPFDRFHASIDEKEALLAAGRLIEDLYTTEDPMAVFQTEAQRNRHIVDTALGTGVDTPLPFKHWTNTNINEFLRGDDWLPTDGTNFVCPQNNFYHFSAHAHISATGAAGVRIMQIVNTTQGFVMCRVQPPATTNPMVLNTSGQHFCFAGDVIQVQCRCGAAGASALGTTFESILSITKLLDDIN